ncbi:VacJ family lipoprotein [Rheinheimera marina]|uniref:VacJ family lipoprotein n=1 Tax=Rheinheimera marina TaxID=1774958 RepID=A0ABV9JRA1_9GAMM
MKLSMMRLVLPLLAITLASGCASTGNTEQQAKNSYADPRDPIESFNRGVWDLNYDVLDAYILRPTTVGYMTVVPKPARQGIANLVNNLDEPVNVVNALLQFKPKSAAVGTGRFVINSTLGLLGLFDVATALDLKEQDEDFGQTLAVWGMPQGPYLMIPAMGPSTASDAAGRVVDNLYFPATWLNTPLALTKAGLNILGAREQLMSSEQLLKESVDPYSFVKEAYFQRRDYEVHDGSPPQKEEDESYLDDYLDN